VTVLRLITPYASIMKIARIDRLRGYSGMGVVELIITLTDTDPVGGVCSTIELGPSPPLFAGVNGVGEIPNKIGWIIEATEYPVS